MTNDFADKDSKFLQKIPATCDMFIVVVYLISLWGHSQQMIHD